jgi:hypothetical protein
MTHNVSASKYHGVWYSGAIACRDNRDQTTGNRVRGPGTESPMGSVLKDVMSTLQRTVAPRYELDIPLRYRRQGEPTWRTGRTVNASRSGVLFQTVGEGLDAGTAIELQLELPGASKAASVHCAGVVVRCERCSPEDLRIAATIDVYTFGADNASLVHALPDA